MVKASDVGPLGRRAAAGVAEKGRGAGASPEKRERRLLSERLLAVLTLEVAALEAAVDAGRPRAAASEEPGAGLARDMRPAADAALPGRAEAASGAAGAKARIETVGQMTRTLEKLLELKRLEMVALRGDETEDGEIQRLAAEMMKRLRILDRRRLGGPGLFMPDGAFVGTISERQGAVAAAPKDEEPGR